MRKKADLPDHMIRLYTVIIFFAILALWTLAWIAKVYVFDNSDWFRTSFGSFVYWTVSKIMIWIMPCFLLLKISNRNIGSVFKPRNSNWLKWGIIIGVALAFLNIASNIFSKQDILAGGLYSFAGLNTIVVAPVLEEFLFRGIILDNLARNKSFWFANTITSGFFLLIHMPGWFFMGTLQENFFSFVGLAIFLLGLVFGLAYKKGESVLSSMIVHALNNIT